MLNFLDPHLDLAYFPQLVVIAHENVSCNKFYHV